MLDPEGSKLKRASNRKTSPDILRDHGVQFEVKNEGAHLIVNGFSTVADFWPGTGKWIVRGSCKTGRGVFNLLKVGGIKSCSN